MTRLRSPQQPAAQLSAVVSSPAFTQPPKKSAAIVIRDADGNVVDLAAVMKTPASPDGPSIQQTKIPSATAQQSRGTAQLADLAEQNRRSAAQLSEMVTKASLAANQSQQSAAYASDILVAAMQHHKQLAAQLSDQMTTMLEHQKHFATQLSDITTTMEHQKHLAAQLSYMMATTMKHSEKFASQLSNLDQPLPQRRFLMALPIWKGESGEENWKAMLKLLLRRDDLYRYVEVDIPQPEDEAERQNWRADRQDIVELLMASIRGAGSLERIRCLGWSPENDGPRETYHIILDAMGSRYDDEIRLVQAFNKLAVGDGFGQDCPEDMHPDDYFSELDKLYDYAIEEHRHIHFHPESLSYFLGGIRACYPEVYDRQAPKINDRSFTWNALFRDIVYDAMRYRFGLYPGSFRELEAPEDGPGFLGGMGILEFWQSVIVDVARYDELQWQLHEEEATEVSEGQME